MTSKRRTPKPKSFIEAMFQGFKSDPAMKPIIETMEDFIDQTLIVNPKPEAILQLQIPPEMYRKLLMLCHPDKHNNSETATEVTRWLIEQRSMYDKS